MVILFVNQIFRTVCVHARVWVCVHASVFMRETGRHSCRFKCVGAEHFPHSFKQTLPLGALFAFQEPQKILLQSYTLMNFSHIMFYLYNFLSSKEIIELE